MSKKRLSFPVKTQPVQVGVGLALATLATASPAVAEPALARIAQILPDNTLPNNSIVTPDGNRFQIDGGTTAGSNLFHSFSDFSVPTGGEAFFNSGGAIDNIITRVTGGSISNIDGLIRANGTANLFFLNPNGIVFGPSARLDIGGSFFGTTADRFIFEDGSFYSASSLQTQPILTVNVPIGVQFGVTTPGQIQVEGTGDNMAFDIDTGLLIRENRPVGLSVSPGNTLALVGGDISLIGGNLTAPSGRVELGSVEQGTVFITPTAIGWELDYAEVNEFAQISFSEESSIDISGGNNQVQIVGQNITLTEARIASATAISTTTQTIPVLALSIFTSDGRTITIDAASLIAQDLCSQGKNSEFIITRRGGLPANPTGLLRGRALWLDERKERSLLIEATGLTTHANGQVELVSRHLGNDNSLGSTLNARASQLLKQGKTQDALETWQKAAEAYKLAGDNLGTMGAIINQAQALQSLGLYRRALGLLVPVTQLLENQTDTQMKAIALQSLGVTLQAIGDLEQSTETLQQSLAIAQKLGTNSSVSGTLLNLGNIATAKSDPQTAIQFYQQAAERATNPLEKTEALLNLLAVYLQQEQGDEAQGLLAKIEAELENLPVSRDGVYARVNLASSLMAPPSFPPTPPASPPLGGNEGGVEAIGRHLATATAHSQELEDKRGEAIALHHLGSLYQKTGQLTAAQKLTEKSLLIAEGIQAEKFVARSHSQLGQILKQQGKIPESIIAYSNAVKGFDALRKDLVAISQDVQFDFRETVEPAYRELVGLLLRSQPSQSQLQQAIDLIEALQLAELDNFFRDSCLEAQPEKIDQIDSTAAVIYPIILPDSLEIILLQQDRLILHHQIKLSQKEVEETILKMRRSLQRPFGANRLSSPTKLYNWLIKPFEAELASNQIQTLVFVLDGNLRNVPMAALYDGEKEKYLMEKYAIALTPGLQLLKSQSLEPEKLQVLTAGISESVLDFSPLPGVEWELEKISEILPSQKLLNQEFTRENLGTKTEENPAPIIHLATHGQFSSNREDTFILAWDEKIYVTEFEQLLRRRENLGVASPIELLVLSACQTALGDKRATLGLAGVAVRSGARSTLATLWSVQDDSTAELIVEFYRQLTNPNISKAEALRRAQVAMLNSRFNLPYFWAPFVLLGNWQ